MNELNDENRQEELDPSEAENTAAEEAQQEEKTSSRTKSTSAKPEKEIQNGNPAARKHKLNKRSLKHGTMAVVLTVLFIAGVVVLNVIVSIISDRFDTTADLTDSGIYTLDEATVSFLADLGQDVTVSVMNSEKSFESGGTYYKSVNELLGKMAMENEHFKLQYLQIDQNPDFTSRFNGETLSENYIVVESADKTRHRILTPADYFSCPTLRDNLSQYGYPETYVEQYVLQYITSSYASQVIEGSNVEQAAVSALMYVTNDEPVRVAFTDGFGESDSSALSSLLYKNGYDVETIDLQKISEIDPDIDYIVMCAPTRDYDNDSLNRLSAFLDNGGSFGKNLIYFASVDQPYYTANGEDENSLTNLSSFLAEWGIAVGDSLVFQTDANYMYGGMEFAHLQEIQDTDYAGNAYNSTLLTYDAYIRPIVQIWEDGSKGSVEQEVLIKSHDGAYLRPKSTLSQSDFDRTTAESGAFNDAVCAKRIHSTADTYSRVVAFGSDMFVGSTFMNYANSNNQDFMINMFNYISGKTKGTTITAKSFTNVGFEVNEEQSNTLAVVLCIVIPVAVIVLGIVIWVRRRHR